MWSRERLQSVAALCDSTASQQFNERLAPDITILVRMDTANEQPADYYLLPIMDIEVPRLLLCESNGSYLDTYQFDSLDYFAMLTTRRKIEEAA